MPHVFATRIRAVLCAGLLALLVGVAPAAAAGPRYVGAQIPSMWSSESPADLGRDLDLLQALGVNAARADVGWSSLESDGPDGYVPWYVGRLDALVNGAAARGIKLIVTLDQSPCWGSTAPEILKQGCRGQWWDRGVAAWAPSAPRAYARAAGFITHRYGSKLAALEIWNEPNLAYNFKAPDRKIARYVALVRMTYPAAKAGNPGVPVLAGALAYSDTGWLQKLYAAGIGGYYDGISLHPYSDGRAPDSTDAPARYEFAAGVRSIRSAQTAAGQLHPLWLTEFGYTACDHAPCATPADQASLIGQSVLALAGLPYVRGASVYQLRDTVDDPGSWEENFGLVRHDFTLRPAFAAFRSALTQLRARRGAAG